MSRLSPRIVDTPASVPQLPRHALGIDRGPFTVEAEVRLMRAHGIDCVVSKNAGGEGAQAKLIAARQLGLPVVMIERPARPAAQVTHEIAGVLRWLGHAAERGV